MKRKQSLTTIFFFKSETKKVAYLKGLNTDLKKSFFLAFKRWVEDQISWLLKDALKSDFLAFKRWVEIR